MAIGDTVQAGLMRVDPSAILKAGEAQARANQAFGDAIGGVVEKFYQKKKEKQKREEREQAYRKMGFSAEEAKAASGDKDLANQFMNKLNADRNYQLRLQDFAMRQEAFKSQQDMLEKDKQATDRFITMLYSQAPTGKLNEAGQDDLERGLAFLPPGPQAREESKNRLLQDPQFQQTEPVISMTGNRFMDQFANESPAVQERALAFMQAEQKRLADLAPDPTDLIKLREEARKTTEFDQGQDAISFSPDRNFLDLGIDAKGQPIRFGISGKFGNEAEVIKLKSEAIPQYENMNAVMNQLIALGEKRKNEVYMSNADKTLAASLSDRLRGLLREDILGPGTVTEPERKILEQIVQNPTTWMDTAGKTQDKINSLKGIRKNAFNKLKTRLTGLGLDVAEVGQSKSSAQNFDQQTPSGLGFTEIDLDQL